MTPLERIEPEVADEVADELDVQMREMTPLEPEVADEFANQCLADSFFARHMDGAAPFDSFDSLGEHAGSSAGSSPDSSPDSSPRNATDASSRYLPADDSLSVCSTEAAGESDGIEAWGVEQVVAFFERCNFPTAGIQAGEVDGQSLLTLYQDSDAESLFMAPAPDGLGFNKLMFKGRFKKEMDKLVAKPSPPSSSYAYI